MADQLDRRDKLRERLGSFAVEMLRLVRRVPADASNDALLRQLARSATGMSSNYRAACCARSRAEFIAKLCVAVEEADETEHWLWMMGELGIGRDAVFDVLVKESHELRAILAASAGTARRNAQMAK